jgi:hypothetical protein
MEPMRKLTAKGWNFRELHLGRVRECYLRSAPGGAPGHSPFLKCFGSVSRKRVPFSLQLSPPRIHPESSGGIFRRG